MSLPRSSPESPNRLSSNLKCDILTQCNIGLTRRQSQRSRPSRLLLAQESRRPRSWLIFDVGQKNMIHDLTGLIHTLAASIAILVGAVVFLRPKGGVWHRRLGYVYSLCMLIVIVTSFAIYRLTGRFNFLHGAAIASSISVGFGFGHAFLRKPKAMWYVLHCYWMSWSFIGLLAALVAEISTRVALPFVVARFGLSSLFGFWCVVGVATLLVVLAGRHLVNKHSPLRRSPTSR